MRHWTSLEQSGLMSSLRILLERKVHQCFFFCLGETTLLAERGKRKGQGKSASGRAMSEEEQKRARFLSICSSSSTQPVISHEPSDQLKSLSRVQSHSHSPLQQPLQLAPAEQASVGLPPERVELDQPDLELAFLQQALDLRRLQDQFSALQDEANIADEVLESHSGDHLLGQACHLPQDQRLIPLPQLEEVLSVVG